MLPKRSTWSGLVLWSAVLGATGLLLPATPSWAQETPATAASSDQKLSTLADDFLHYSIVGNESLAKDTGQAILNSKPSGRDLLVAFEAAANDRDVPGILQRNQRRPELKDVSKQLEDLLNEGHRAVARDPERVKTEIDRLDDSPRAYNNAKDRLTAAGPFAVPYYIQYLQDSKQASLHPYIVRVMTEIGRSLLPPLLEELQTSDLGKKMTLVNVIGQIGYPQAIPYLKEVGADPSSAPLRAAADAAITKCDVRSGMSKLSLADAFYTLAQQLYQKDPVAAAPYPDEPSNPVWFYDKGLDNVVGVPVPTTIWSSVETMRATEAALYADANKSAATSLWIAANLRREILLPAGAKDPTRPEGALDASFYAVAAGPVYLNPVLETALAEKDTPLVLKTVLALESTGGTQGLVSSQKGATPLVRALSYPDRAVRFAAAFALARANPAKDYPGSFRVIPVLVEAVAQTGGQNILLALPNQQQRNRLKGFLTQMNYNVYDDEFVDTALDRARNVASFDALIVPDDSNSIAQIRGFATTDYRLASPPVILIGSNARPAGSGVTLLPPDADDKALAAALAGVKSQIGQTAIDQAAATNYSTTAIRILAVLASDHASIYNVNDAVPALREVLKDKRPEVVTAAVAVLGQLNNPDAQKAVAAAALADNADNALRATLLGALAESAKRAGNALDAASIDRLIQIVTTKETDPAVRLAAATALGALNVPSNQASALILQQAK